MVAEAEAEAFRRRWAAVKGTFPDDPRAAVQQAKGLLGEVTELLNRRLEEDLRKREDPSTEDLRVALQRYRALFERLLSA